MVSVPEFTSVSRVPESQDALIQNFKNELQKQTDWFKNNKETIQKDYEMTDAEWDEYIWEKETQDKYNVAYVQSICKAPWFVKQVKEWFDEVDANKDGQLSPDEVKKDVLSKMSEIGMSEEIMAQNPEQLDAFIAETFKYFDLDGNNKISFDEYLVINAVNRFSAKMQPEVMIEFVPVPVEMDPASMTQEERRASIQLPGKNPRALQNGEPGIMGTVIQDDGKVAKSGLFPCC